MRYFAGIDGGATKTTCVICDSKGECLGVGRAGPSNYQNTGAKRALSNLEYSMTSAKRFAGLVSTRISVLCVGLAGLDSKNDYEILWDGIERMNLALVSLLRHDATIALYGAFAGEPGVLVNAGTGSVAAGLNSTGDVERVGGWGFIIGDEGSGYEVGRRALGASLKVYDRSGPPTELLARVMARFRVSNPEELLKIVYASRPPVRKIASLASIVAEAAASGDEVAKSILSEAGEALADMTLAAARNSGLLSKRFKIATMGGVFNSGDAFLLPFVRRLHSKAKTAEVVSPKLAPPLGALLMALRHDNVRITKRVLSTLKETGERKLHEGIISKRSLHHQVPR